VICFPGSRGFLIYRVESGDTLTGIVRKLKDFTKVTVKQVVAANPRIEDPDVIVTGWRLRIPVQG
jgi:LysM repeat protein